MQPLSKSKNRACTPPRKSTLQFSLLHLMLATSQSASFTRGWTGEVQLLHQAPDNCTSRTGRIRNPMQPFSPLPHLRWTDWHFCKILQPCSIWRRCLLQTPFASMPRVRHCAYCSRGAGFCCDVGSTADLVDHDLDLVLVLHLHISGRLLASKPLAVKTEDH